jgi:hypothetical protein
MTTNQGNTALSNTILSWGFASIQDFAREQAKNILQQKITYYQSQINYFEQKYGMAFGEFCDNFEAITNHTLFEKEDDSIRWESIILVLKEYKDSLNEINI